MPRNKSLLGTSKLDQPFKDGMAGKKVHEVENLAHLIGETNQSLNCPTIIDVGAGKGYLSHVLTHYYKLQVINLEGQESHNQEANKRTNQVSKKLKQKQEREKKKRLRELSQDQLEKVGDGDEDEKPESILVSNLHYFLSKDMNTEEFERAVAQSIHGMKCTNKEVDQLVEESDTKQQLKIGLISLHGCGDLSCTILRLYSKWDSARTLISVGCCYVKIDQDVLDCSCSEPSKATTTSYQNFPMSESCRKIISNIPDVFGNRFRGVLELANDTPPEFETMTDTELIFREKQIYFRAILESALNTVLIDTPFINGNSISVKKVKSNLIEVGFSAWLESAVDQLITRPPDKLEPWKPMRQFFMNDDVYMEFKMKLKLEATRLYEINNNNDTSSSINTTTTNESKKMLFMLSLQYSLARLCESLILLDRYFFLKEQGLDCRLVPIFDFHTSPRNIAIISTKEEK
eukprot:TRINITY_DN6056_c0_g1_i1.p1 TRINITY_DN6056_c0_g1~~TRINITY_DN6056_c0_g1_i1.p1  ORF type:complete len:461 (+),score=63.62 TRINITY_DN6056_c0_g1_i1:347-1729(+)